MTSVVGALLLPLLLASCAEQTPPPPAPIMLLPPESVFTPCEQPKLQGDTWGDIGSHALALQTALSICAGQVATLNQWREAAGRKQ
ncbi:MULTISPECIES: Rz1-like lysis system protein LysC [unclassified Serratia (in: enterobacteria)]|uniref:Rz1-like lysis system protein LysC n=1 Tax=unclassified Serratia (in: enterobacteria) TaxID=2647522 RepID=UPI00117A21FE|nr:MULTISPECIES: Rz1-like lysis system protein LysC [unclassified Serratia (in: enterobacteria)]